MKGEGKLASISSTLNVRIFCTNLRFGSFYNVHATRKSCQNDVRTKKRAFYVDEIDTFRKKMYDLI